MKIVVPYNNTPERMKEEAETFLNPVQSILGNPWTTVSSGSYWQFQLVHPDGPKIFIDCSDSKRYQISGVWPRDSQNNYYEGNVEIGSISASRNRGVEAVVKDIKRRFLDDYLAEYDRICEVVMRTSDLHDQQTSRFQELCKVIGYEPTEREQGQAIVYCHGLHKIEVTAGENNTVKIETSYIPFKDAKAILKVFAKRLPKESSL